MYFSTLNEAYGDQSLDGMYVKKIEGPPVAPAPAVHGTSIKEKKCGCACKGGYQETNTLLLLIIFLMMVFKK